MNSQIKQGYADAIAQYLASGGKITPAVNSSKAPSFNPNLPAGGLENFQLRKEAEQKGLKSYSTLVQCEKCNTSERSVKTNACLACDRRRARSKTGLSDKTLQDVGLYLLDSGKSIEFTSGGQTYVLKIEAAQESTNV